MNTNKSNDLPETNWRRRIALLYTDYHAAWMFAPTEVGENLSVQAKLALDRLFESLGDLIGDAEAAIQADAPAVDEGWDADRPEARS